MQAPYARVKQLPVTRPGSVRVHLIRGFVLTATSLDGWRPCRNLQAVKICRFKTNESSDRRGHRNSFPLMRHTSLEEGLTSRWPTGYQPKL